MKYAVEMGSPDMIHIPSFIKIGSGIQTLIGGYSHRQHGDTMSLLLFFLNKESRLKIISQKIHCTTITKTNKSILLGKKSLLIMRKI
jgi:hypothetical protein